VVLNVRGRVVLKVHRRVSPTEVSFKQQSEKIERSLSDSNIFWLTTEATIRKLRAEADFARP